MKKVLVISLLIVLAAFSVVAVDQGAEGEVVADLTFTLDPETLSFGSLTPGQTGIESSSGTAGTSPLTMLGISVTPGNGTVFTENNVMFDIPLGTGFVFAPDFDPFDIAAESVVSWDVSLTIPVGTSPESFTGTVTYTVVEDTD